jgi:hypothetical protein
MVFFTDFLDDRALSAIGVVVPGVPQSAGADDSGVDFLPGKAMPGGKLLLGGVADDEPRDP